jgi:hypothetical protein
MPIRNPWAHSRTEREFDDPAYAEAVSSKYAVPNALDGDSPWMDSPSGGWAPTLRLSPTGIPDITRLNDGEYVDTRPQDGLAEAREYWGNRNAETNSREAVTITDSTGFGETKGGFGHPEPSQGANRFAPPPRATPPPEPRLTSQLSPHTYRFWRPFQGRVPHRFTGEHFSMADHRRDYPIYGMAPQRRPGGSTRNTYRLPPAPWDAYMQDQAPESAPVHAENVDVNVPYPSRSWRLD